MNDKTAEAELLNLAITGDAPAFEALVKNHYELVYRCAFRYCGNKEDAEDVAQDVFVKVADKIKAFEKRSSFSSWLYRIAINTATDLLRKKSKTSTVPYENGVEKHNKPHGNPGLSKDILSAVETLPIKIKDAVILVYAEELSHRKAAEILGCAETTISWRIFQAKKKLKKALS